MQFEMKFKYGNVSVELSAGETDELVGISPGDFVARMMDLAAHVKEPGVVEADKYEIESLDGGVRTVIQEPLPMGEDEATPEVGLPTPEVGLPNPTERTSIRRTEDETLTRFLYEGE